MTPSEALRIKNEAIARLAQAFTNPVRLRLLGILNQGEASVEVLAEKTGQSGANTSAQLRQLASANVVVARREGRHIYYRLASPGVRRLWKSLQEEAAASSPALRELVRDWYGPLDPDDVAAARVLMARVVAGEVTLLDVRPPDEHAAGHLPGARNISADTIEAVVDTLPPGRPVVVYCRGRYCVLAADCVRRLQGRGVDVRNLAMGVADWEAAGLPVSSSAASRPAVALPENTTA
ncbi:MAG: metalloregulator ArsR/SmtB family transcription factor [Pseudomonadota bacterium]|nr:metalloregulator ArsR/SmtB family transcription factor [Pseudomonadota bacterium]